MKSTTVDLLKQFIGGSEGMRSRDSFNDPQPKSVCYQTRTLVIEHNPGFC